MTELKEPISVARPGEIVELKEEPLKSKRIYLQAFRGNRNPAAMAAFDSKVLASRMGEGQGPTEAECLVYTGHVGISFEGLAPIYGFNPSTGTAPVHEVMDTLKKRLAYPGKVTDDTEAFNLAAAQGLEVVRIEYVCSEEVFNKIKVAFDKAKSSTALRYSFPDGAGDFNCATWPLDIGVPIPSGNGNMKEYMKAMQSSPKVRYLGLMPEL